MRALVTCIAYTALVVALAFGADRAVSAALFVHPTDFVPAFRSYTEFSTGEKMHQLRGLDTSRFETLVIGDSLAMYGIRPSVFDSARSRAGAPGSSYNLAIPAVSVDFWPQFFDRWWRRPLPCRLALTVEPRTLDAVGLRVVSFSNPFFFSSEGFRHRDMSTVTYDSENLLSRAFVLWGRRGDLFQQSPRQVLEGDRYRVQVVPISDNRGWARWGDRNDAPEFHLSAAALAREAARAPHPPARHLRFAPSARAAIVDLARRQERHGGTLALITTPTLSDSSEFGSQEIWRDVARQMRQLAARLPNVQFIDARSELGRFGPKDFGDGRHLDERGADRFSAGLGRLFARQEAAHPCGSSSGGR